MFPPPKAKQLVAEFQASYLHMKGSFCEVTQMVTRGTEFLGLSLALGHWTSHCLSGPQCSRLIRKGLHYTISIASFFSFFISKSISVVVWYNLNWVKLKSHFCEEFWLRVVHRAIAMTSGGRSVAAPTALGRHGGFRAGLCCCYSWLTRVWPTAPPLALLALWVLGQAHAQPCAQGTSCSSAGHGSSGLLGTERHMYMAVCSWGSSSLSWLPLSLLTSTGHPAVLMTLLPC